MRVPTEKALATNLKSTDACGTEPEEIERYLREAGFVTYRITNISVATLRCQLRHGWHPIIDWADWGGHWVLVLSYQQKKGWSGGQFMLADPAAKYEGRSDGLTYVGADRLESMWFSPIGGERGLCIFATPASAALLLPNPVNHATA